MKSSKADIVNKISEIIEDVTLGNVSAADIKPNDQILQDLGLDSLDYASVLLGCEQWLGIRIQEKDVDWRAIQSVEQLAAFLEAQQ